MHDHWPDLDYYMMGLITSQTDPLELSFISSQHQLYRKPRFKLQQDLALSSLLPAFCMVNSHPIVNTVCKMQSHHAKVGFRGSEMNKLHVNAIIMQESDYGTVLLVCPHLQDALKITPKL